MGCGASLPEGGGAAGLRPFLLQRLEDIRLRRQTRPVKASDSTPSKKELLEPEKTDEDEDNHSSSHTNSYKTAPISPVKNAGKQVDEEDDKFFTDDGDDDPDDERRIRRGDGDFPGSPSFRVYFNDDDKEVHGKSLASKGFNSSDENGSYDDITPSKECPERKKKTRRGRKRRSFGMVIPRGGQVKNLLNVTSCYTPSHSSANSNDETRLLPTKIASN